VQALGREARNVVGVLVLDRCGRKDGQPALETPAYPDPLRPGATVVAPAFLVRSAIEGARAAGEPLTVGDPLVPWIYQAVVRTFRVTDLGDERPFLEAGVPALRLSDRRFFSPDEYDRQPTDTVERLDAQALGREGRALLGTLTRLPSTEKPAGADGQWFARFGLVAGRDALLGAGAVSILPGLFVAGRASGVALVVRLLHAGLFGVLAWAEPAVAVFVFLLPNLLTAFRRRLWIVLLGLVPALALLLFGALAWSRGLVRGVHQALWELSMGGLVLALALLSPRRLGRPKPARARGKKNLSRR
jgi:hypothetical protein